MLAALLCLSLAAFATSAPLQQAADGTVTVQVEDGILRGNVATSIWNRTYYSFQNVPYAQPPVGDLRFKSPKPVVPWTGVRDARTQGSYCPQDAVDYTTANMSEDCLYLNVYIPEIASSEVPTAGLTVMVWIHGGGFVLGSGIKDFFGPDHLMNQTVMLVSINYRLGPLGYLNIEHPEMSSNAGMKDQVAALRWVKRNIAHFGGNPDDVTVFGESAGGTAVEMLLMSPMTEGLFHGAISESGSGLWNVSYSNATQLAFLLGEVLGFNGTSTDDLVVFLRSVAAEDLMNALDVAAAQQNTHNYDLGTYPTVDASIQEGNEVFLTDTPENLLRAGKSHPIPFMSGVNSEESVFTAAALTQADLDNYNNNPDNLIPAGLNIRKGTQESRELGQRIKSFYFGNESISFYTMPQLVNLLSDNFMIYYVYRSSRLHARYGSSPFYLYLFTYDGTAGTQLGNSTIKGPQHTDELRFLFTMNNVHFHPNSDDMKVLTHFTNMWVDYARYRNPSVRESVKWTPVSTNSTYLQIDLELSLHEGFLRERMAFWDQVYDIYNK